MVSIRILEDMSQPSISTYFNTRKRLATDELQGTRSKVRAIDTNAKDAKVNLFKNGDFISDDIPQPTKGKIVDKGSTPGKGVTPTKIVRFTLAGNLSPRKNLISTNLANANLFASKVSVANVDKGTQTPTKQLKDSVAKKQSLESVKSILRDKAKKESNENIKKTDPSKLSLDQIKQRVTRSSRLQDLKESLLKLNKLEETRQKLLEKNTGKITKSSSDAITQETIGQSLKAFKTIDLEVLTSPQKGFRTPTKSIGTSIEKQGDQNELMSPKETIPRRLFSPEKTSPSKIQTPAYQRFQALAESGRPTLQLPYKYRCMAETFRCVDTVCAMFFNRKETITFKKLKPAVQRMLRKNFSETNLAQIKYLWPLAYSFHQKKMLNPGSHTKYDYYQLIIKPTVTIKDSKTTKGTMVVDEDDVFKMAQEQSMNPAVMTERQKKFQHILLDKVKIEHDKFLKSLDPPLIIPMDKLTRWHPEFDLENCPDILRAPLPQPPNIETFSSAKDILSTARNLFNCATPTERMMERLEAHQKLEGECELKRPDPVIPLLKGVPKSLLDKIRAKQAAKALETMTRRPSQDCEANKYGRLPELTRYLRNIFVTENKSCLELDLVLSKIQNSYREQLSRDTLKELLNLMEKEAPGNWLTFHHIRKTDFVKINRSANLAEVIATLERKAEERNK